jgi:hypothetical protein
MKTVKFVEVFNVEDILKEEWPGDCTVTAYEFKGDCVMLVFCFSTFHRSIFKWCESLESAKEFYNKWKELGK